MMQKGLKYSYMAVLLFCVVLTSYAQQEKKVLHDGNKSYFGGKVLESSNLYKKALKENPNYYKANFNLGDALYQTASLIRTGKVPVPDKRMTPDSAANLVFDQAAEQFEVTAKSTANTDTAQKAWHNYGNAKLQQKNYEDAVMGYKKALKLNPKDEDTRYNLAYAQRKLKEQQKNQNKNQDQNKQNQDKQQQEKDKEKVNNPNDQDKQEAQPPQMSKEQAEQMLNALKNSEKNNQKLRDKKGEGQRKNVDKDW